MMNLREVDKLVMLHVMGNVWPEDRCRICGWTLKENILEGCTKDSCSLRPAPVGRADAPAPYSSDPDANQRVRAKLSETYQWMLACGYRDGERFFVFSLYSRIDAEPLFSAEGKTEEEATSRCALKSVGVEVPA